MITSLALIVFFIIGLVTVDHISLKRDIKTNLGWTKSDAKLIAHMQEWELKMFNKYMDINLRLMNLEEKKNAE